MNQTITVDFDAARQAAEADGIFSSLCTIKAPPGTLDAAGQPDLNPANFTNVFVDIPCQVCPNIKLRPVESQEVQLQKWTYENSDLHVLLDGHYPSILAKHIAVLDGVVTNIRVVENDSKGTTTRLGCARTNQ